MERFPRILFIIPVILLVSAEVLFAGGQEVYCPVIEVANLTISQSKAAVKRAIQRRFPISEITEEGADYLVFSFTVRRHSAKNRIVFGDTSIAFEFLSSENLDYRYKGGRHYIHKNYNSWIGRLEEYIKQELLNPSADLEVPDTKTPDRPPEPAPPDPGVAADETHIHIIRQKSMVGAIMTVSVGVNDQLIGQLKSSTYCTFKGKAGPITVTVLQANALVASAAVDDRPGREVFLNYNYKRGTLTEIPRTEGLRFLKEYEPMPLLTSPKPNPGYVTGLMNPGIFDDSLMTNASALLTPDLEHAVVTFVGDYEKFKSIPTGIWTADGFLGSLNGRSLFQVKVKPGRHYFLAKYEHWAVLEAEVNAEKAYLAQVTITRGMTQPHVRIIPVTHDTDSSTVDRWLSSYEKLTYRQDYLSDTLRTRLTLTMPYIEQALENVRNKRHETRVLNASDFR